MKKRIIQGSCMFVFLLFFVGYGICEENKDKQMVVAEITSEQEAVVMETDAKDTGNEKIEELEIEDEEVARQEEGEYEHLAFANVNDYVNVRSEPSTDGTIVGRIYDGAVAEIIALAGEEQDWYEITSGNVTGYIKAEFFLRGNEAADVMDKYIVLVGSSIVERLNVRSKPDKESEKIGFLSQNEKVSVIEKGQEWTKILYDDEQEGYVFAQYFSVREEFLYAKTMDEIKEIEKKEREKAEKIRLEKQKGQIEAEPLEVQFMENEGELRLQIVDYAMQYVGNKYISGGQSLAGGTDCSGFTCFVYADFGYSISRTPQGQLTNSGRSIDYSEAKPGDIICYSSNGGKSCTHVALYIGDGKIVHSANSRKGVIVQNADYDRIIGVKNIIN